MRRYLKTRYVLPPEKGVWIWWIGPLIIGAAAGPQFTVDLAILTVAALGAFLIRQPVSQLIRAYRLGRLDAEGAPSAAWLLILAVPTIASGATLLAWGHGWLIPLAAICLAVIVWQLWLLMRGEERHQSLRDHLAAGVLALAGPAAYWSCGGGDHTAATLVWFLPALQASASVTHIFLRLRQRKLRAFPPLAARLREALLPMLHHSGALLATGILAVEGIVPPLVVAAFALTAAEGFCAILRPPVRKTPFYLGMRQLAVSSAFTALVAFAFAD